MRDKKQRAKRARRDREIAHAGATSTVIAVMDQLDIDRPLDDEELALDTFPDFGPSRGAGALVVTPIRIHRAAGIPSFRADGIVRPAILFQDHVYSKEDSYRHHEILAAMYPIFGGRLDGEEEGFLTADGSYASPRHAKEIVRLLQQATIGTLHDYRLLAEELWP